MPQPRLRLTPLAAPLALLLAAPAAPGAEVLTDVGRLEGAVERTRASLVVREGGWTVRVPAARALVLRRDGRRTALPAAEALEDAGLEHESRGRVRAAGAAYRGALAAVLAAARAGARPAEVQGHLEVYLRRLHYFAGEAERPAALAALSDVVAAAGRGEVAAYAGDLARYYRAWHARRQGEEALVRADEEALGFCEAFFLCGPFDNERGTGFGLALPPETEPFDPEAVYEGKGRPVGWWPLPLERLPLGEVDLDACVQPDDQALAYAVTYVHAEAATPVALRVGSDEAIRLWLNREEVLARDVRRPLGFDQDACGVVLRPGWNEVLVEVGEQTGSWGFRLRVTAPAGGPPPAGVRPANLTEVASAPDPDGAGGDAEPAAVPVATGAADALAGAVAADPTDWRAAFHLGYLRWTYRAHDQGEHPDRDALTRACRAAPANPHLRVFLAYSLQAGAEFSVNREDNARRAALEEAIRLDPGHGEARWLLAVYYLDDLGNAAKARRVLAPALAESPGYLDGLLLSFDLMERADLEPLAASARRRLVERLETEVARGERAELPAVLLERLAGEAASRGDVRRQEALARRLLALEPGSPDHRADLAELARDAGRRGEAARLYAEAIAAAPYRLDLRWELAEVHAEAGDLDAAARALEDALALAPADERLVEELGHVEERRGRAARAEALFERALELDPGRVDLRDYLEFRTRHRRDADAGFEAEWLLPAEPALAAAEDVPLDPRRTHRYLLRQVVHRVNQDGTKSELVQELIRVENTAGARRLAAYGTVYESDQRLEFQLARVWRRGGGVEGVPVGRHRARRGGEFERRLRASVAFPPLEPGDVVEVRYRTDDLEPGFFGDYYGHTQYLQGEQAIDRLRFVVIAPPGRELYFHTPGLAGLGVERATRELPGGAVAHVFDAAGVPALDSEPNQPWVKELLPKVQASTFRDWDAFSRWYWGLVAKQHESDPALRAKVAELTAGAESDLEKVRRIYDFVVTEVRYSAEWEFGVHGFKPYNATRIFARRFGDCKDKSTLINTMLREVGIDSYPVLIYGETSRGREDLTLPLIGHFNHCISWVDVGEGGLFVDGTAEHHPCGTLPTMDYGAKVVVITPEGARIRAIPYEEPAEQAVRERHVVRLEEGGSATLETVIEATGQFGVALRSWLAVEGRRADQLEPRLGQTFNGARVTSVETSDLSDLSTPVRIEVEVEVPRMLRRTTAGDQRLLEVRSWLFDQLYLGGRKVSALAADDRRTRDVVLPYPAAVEEEVTYVLPPGAEVESLPAPVELEAEFGRYRRVYSVEGDRITLERRLAFEETRVPAEAYGAFREFLGAIERAEADRPVLSQGASD